jgi:hypothetical protein
MLLVVTETATAAQFQSCVSAVRACNCDVNPLWHQTITPKQFNDPLCGHWANASAVVHVIVWKYTLSWLQRVPIVRLIEPHEILERFWQVIPNVLSGKLNRMASGANKVLVEHLFLHKCVVTPNLLIFSWKSAVRFLP